jgi:predicted DNA-binding transcriptional regulator AlpA
MTDVAVAPPRPEPLLPWSKARPLLGDIGRSTAWRLVRAGKLAAPIKLSPGRVAWRESDLHAFQERQARLTGAAS